jgi:hypothetical protein
MRHLPKTGDQVGAADRGAAMLAHQPMHKRWADILILDQRADALAYVIGEGGVLLAKCRATRLKPSMYSSPSSGLKNAPMFLKSPADAFFSHTARVESACPPREVLAIDIFVGSPFEH